MVETCDYDKHRGIAEALCVRALEGAVSLEKFHLDWPCRPEAGTYWQTLRDDLEDAITHAPGTWVGGKVDIDLWKRSYEYVVVYFHRKLLTSNVDPSKFLELRAKALSGKRVSLSIVDDVIREAQVPAR